MLDPAFLKQIRRRERIAQRVIVFGGILIVICVLGILLQIASVALPLFFPPSYDLIATVTLPDLDAESTVAFGVDDYLETGFVLERSGRLRYFGVETGEVLSTETLSAPGGEGARIRWIYRHGLGDYSVVWTDGSISRDVFTMFTVFDQEGNRSIEQRTSRSFASGPQEEGELIAAIVAPVGDGFARVNRWADGRLEVHVRLVTESLFGDEETTDERFSLQDDLPGSIADFILAELGNELYATTENGYLLRWSWDFSDAEDPVEPVLKDEVRIGDGAPDPTVLAFVFGDQSVVVGDAEGGLSRWFPVRSAISGGRRELERIQDLPGQKGSVVSLHPTQRDKSVISLGGDGRVQLTHTTSERLLLSIETEPSIVKASLNRRGAGLAGLSSDGVLHVWTLDNPHPEVNFKTLFGKVWYEGYDEPSFDWQSSAATQDSEPKLSLVPLIFGTIKGTLYAMIFAVPIAILGALYTSQFLSPRLRGVVKPLIEIMAAIPSVVIGFLAAQWFAPILQRSMGGLLLSFMLLPVMVLLTFFLWHRLGIDRVLRRFSDGMEFFWILPSLLIAVVGSLWVGSWMEPLLFGGDMQTFLYESVGVVYDPRNCIVISFALGFAVIPIIFTIAEDSLSNVPRALSAGSLALGASRWQTAWRVILPAGLPGIFAALMIGLGRAIGETMIVLMATGNTAIMDWSPFNGMRTISANIATEAPEAPHLGSLYRVLFLSAVILFISTFLLNTVAEIVRHRIRKKFARF